jgi:hypothetical protein
MPDQIIEKVHDDGSFDVIYSLMLFSVPIPLQDFVLTFFLHLDKMTCVSEI